MITLRPHQREAVDAIFAYFGRSDGNPLCVLPTASGKSYIAAAFIRQAIEAYPDTRILVATHRAELIEQDARAIQTYWPEADVGVYSAGLGHRRIRPITVGGVQSLVNVDGLPAFDLMLIDEAHLVPKEGDGHYRTLIAKLREKNPDLKIVGLTATPYRLNGGRLTRGKDKIFDSIAFELPVQRLVDEGMLSPLVSPLNGVGPGFDTGKVKTSGGDFAVGALASAVEAQENITRAALTEAASLAADRQSWLVFCVSIEHARQSAAMLFELGISAQVVTGMDDMGSRKRKLAAFKAGENRALVNCDLLTIGFDAPRTDCIVMLRPTQSTGLYVQICGRGMRLSPETGKKDCLVLDFGGNVERHGPITDVKPKESREGKTPNIKICPKCDAEIKQHLRVCPECGHEFPLVPREIDHETKASRNAIMGPPPEPTWIPISRFTLERWEKRPTESMMQNNQIHTPTVVVNYFGTGNIGASKPVAREWICPEHGGFARKKFEKWWKERSITFGADVYPNFIDQCTGAIGLLRPIEAIAVEPDGKYTRVTKVRFAAEREPGSDDVPPTGAVAADYKVQTTLDEVLEHEDIVNEMWGEESPF